MQTTYCETRAVRSPASSKTFGERIKGLFRITEFVLFLIIVVLVYPGRRHQPARS